MPTYIELIPIDRNEVLLGEPIPYDIYNDAGGLLIAREQVVADQEKIDQLLKEGLRVRPPGPRTPTRGQESAAPRPGAVIKARDLQGQVPDIDAARNTLGTVERMLSRSRRRGSGAGAGEIVARTVPAAPRRRPPLEEAKALIAEDMKLSQQLLANMLNRHRLLGIETADDGLGAVRKFGLSHYDLVFLDIDMPVMDGLDALERIKAIDPEAFVCLVSANGTRLNVQRARGLGVNGFLVKPISGLNIERVLKLYMEGK